MANTSTLKDAITERLRALGADKTALMAVAERLAGVDAGQIIANRVHSRGIPVPDEWVVSSIVTAGALPRLVEHLTQVPAIGSIRIFPYGIPIPDIYRIELTAGAAGE